MTALDLTPLHTFDDLGDSGLHIACCVDDRFLCGAPFHQEARAEDETPDAEVCPTCVDIDYGAVCDRRFPVPHSHCPFGLVRVCPG